MPRRQSCKSSDRERATRRHASTAARNAGGRPRQRVRCRDMRRRIFTIVSAVPLLLSAAMAAFWVRSHVASESCYWRREMWELSLSASQGRIAFYWGEPSNDEGSSYRVGFGHARTRPPAGFDLYLPAGVGTNWPVFDGGGFALVGGQWDGLRHWSLVVPCWFLVVAFAFLPSVRWFWAIRATRARASGQCLRCGYDLRATPDRCPECGSVPKSKVAQEKHPG